jgi:hypothetical protein
MNLLDLEQNTKSDLIQIATKYNISYRTKTGEKFSSNYNQLTREELISAIRSDNNFLKDSGKKSKIDRLKQKISNTTDADIIMRAILDIFGTTNSIPTPGNYYTYIYTAKTPQLMYDIYPLIACFEIKSWGFTGLNFHLSLQRNYTWEEVSSNICIIEPKDISYFRTLKYKKLRFNN